MILPGKRHELFNASLSGGNVKGIVMVDVNGII